MRASRMMSLLLHLQVRGQATGAELARLLEVSERTVQRDAEALAASGVPIRSTRGPAGGYRLDGGYRTRLTGLGLDEAGALAFLGLAGPAAQLGLGELLEGARVKVWAGLTGEARDRASATAARFHLDPVRFFGTAEPVPCLTALATAVWSDRRARIVYTTRSGDTATREVDPLGLVLAAGVWYLVALRDGARRTYRVSRVRSVETLETPVRRPARFDLAASWADARADLERERTAVEVTLRVAGHALSRLRECLPVHGHDRLPAGTAAARVEVTVPFESLEWAVSALLGLGAAVEVLAPADLRARIAAEVRGAAAHYRL
ncbi:helix-turn-helix transcriptional regulator [Catenuloplanes atrovinosus]|uniref:DNA-binding transcriptional regulator YafY n=1 Tax=Catenuloplanes atrovinosus TaxID=137266 RepID=A0AAE3YL44_9ACTN|nr:WYL domain-containing protein [Catenuloplanes atrovinosus]MDR7275828.1 putative DNA-binding transcriptional regulator YafY [Catenuloplanes atrovinosus]